MSTSKTFDVQSEGRTLVVAPLVNVSGLAETDVRPELEQLLKRFDETAMRNVVIDFGRISYFGTTMLGAMHVLWKHVRAAGGKTALCNVSDVQREVLQVARFDTMWPICDSRQEALGAVAD